MPSESAMLSATAITSKAPITLAFGLPDVARPKIIPKLVTVEDVAPKLNLLGSVGKFNFTEQPSKFYFDRNVHLQRDIYLHLNLHSLNKHTMGTGIVITRHRKVAWA